MKKLILSASVAFSVLATTNIYAQQGFGTNEPDRSSAIDIVSNKRGLLIPRIALSSTTVAAPVNTPANALLVYNNKTAGDVTPGFYYWEADANASNTDKGRWVRFVASNSGNAVTVTEGINVKVDKTTNGHDTNYEVSVKGGDKAGLVLVTKIVDGVNSTEWVNPSTFVSNVIEGANGVTVVPNADGKNTVKLGGTPLSEPTIIQTTLGVDGKPDNTLAIKGLEKLDGSTGKEFSPLTQNLVIMGEDGILKTVTPKEMIEKTIAGGTVNGKALTSSSLTIGANGATSLLKDVNIEITAGTTAGQVLVTKVVGTGDTSTTSTEWVDAGNLGNTVTASNGVKKVGNEIKLGSEDSLTEPTQIKTTATNTLAIEGLSTLDKGTTTGNNVVMADANGVLKQTSSTSLITDAITGGNIEAKTLKGEGITVTAGGTVGGDSAVVNSLLKDVTLGIAAGAVTNDKIATGAVTADKIASKDTANGSNVEEGKVPVADGNGGVTYQNVSSAIGQDLTTDGKIVIGADKSSELANSVLVATNLSIKEGSIGTTELTDGAITTEKLADNAVTTAKIEAGTGGTVLVTNTDGTVVWINQSTLNNKDNFIGTSPILINPSTGNNTTGGKEYTISIDSANGTTAGVVKQAEANPTILFNDGVASVNLENLSSTKGKALTSGSIVVTGGEKALLNATTLEIKGGEAAGQVLVTKVDNNITSTEWVNAADLGNTVTASNGVTKDGNDIQLGGALTGATTIETAVDKTLAITGLNAPLIVEGKPVAVKNMVVGPDGKLYTQSKGDRTGFITIKEGGNINISNLSTYNVNQDEVVIEVTLGATDTNLTLPTPSGVEGQTISVKIVNTADTHIGYLNIISEGTLSYGSMPYQGWIIKSNGSKWIIVGRN